MCMWIASCNKIKDHALFVCNIKYLILGQSLSRSNVSYYSLQKNCNVVINRAFL